MYYVLEVQKAYVKYGKTQRQATQVFTDKKTNAKREAKGTEIESLAEDVRQRHLRE